MPLKLSYPTKEDIPEAVLEFYEEADGVWKLQADGMKTEDDVKAIKDALKNERDARKTSEADFKKQLKAWEGLDPEQVRTFMSRLEEDEDTKLLAEGKIDEVLAKRTERMQGDHAKQIEARETEITALKATVAERDAQLARLVVDGAVRDAAGTLKLVETATADALTRARSIFSVDEHGEPVALDADGTKKLGKDGKSPLTPAEWLDGMKETAPHWWPPSGGGGAPGSNGSGGGGMDNPFHKDTFNLTKQGVLVRENPDLAERLRREAGSH